MVSRTIPQHPTIKLNLSLRHDDPVSELNQLIRKCSDPSFDRWTNLAHLHLEEITITTRLLNSMIEFVNLPFAKDPTGTGDEDFKWIWVTFQGCLFALGDITPYVDQVDWCTFDDVEDFFCVMTYRALHISIESSPVILMVFLGIDCDDFEVDDLRISQYQELICHRPYEKLGDRIRRSVHLRKLYLRLPFTDEADVFFDGLANLIEIQELSLERALTRKRPQKNLADIVVGKSGDDCPVMRLLQNPRNQLTLKKLSLRCMGLKDHHLSALLQVISTSQIEVLDFSRNLIRLQGMLEFANILPRMHSLKHVDFQSNPWENAPFTDADRTMVGAALLQGLMANTWIVSMHGMGSTPQALLLWHYLALNRAGRQILASNQPIPDGLWPVVLERAWKTMSSTSWFVVACGRRPREDIDTKCDMANAVYYFLTKCPKILSFRRQLHFSNSLPTIPMAATAASK